MPNVIDRAVSVVKYNTPINTLVSLKPDQEGNKLQLQKILISYILFIIITGGILILYIYIYIYITRLASNAIFLPSNKIHREEDRAKDLSALLYFY